MRETAGAVKPPCPKGGVSSYASVHVVPVSTSEPPIEVTVPHGIDRIEAMGSDAVVVGSALVKAGRDGPQALAERVRELRPRPR